MRISPVHVPIVVQGYSLKTNNCLQTLFVLIKQLLFRNIVPVVDASGKKQYIYKRILNRLIKESEEETRISDRAETHLREIEKKSQLIGNAFFRDGTHLFDAVLTAYHATGPCLMKGFLESGSGAYFPLQREDAMQHNPSKRPLLTCRLKLGKVAEIIDKEAMAKVAEGFRQQAACVAVDPEVQIQLRNKMIRRFFIKQGFDSIYSESPVPHIALLKPSGENITILKV